MKTVLFVRHGQSEAQLGAPTDAPGAARLTKLGREQASLTADYLHSISNGQVLLVNSSYRRSIETADAIEKRAWRILSRIEMPVQEFTYLAWEGLRGTTAQERLAFVEKYWAKGDATHIDGPGAESFEGVMHRVVRVLRSLRELPDKNIIVVSHANFMRALLFMILRGDEYLEDMDANMMKRYQEFRSGVRFPNTAVVPVMFNDLDEGRRGWLAGGISDGHLPEEKRSE